MLQRNRISAFFLSVATIFAALPAAAETWPARPLTMVVPFGAGSASDTIGRVLAARLSEVLGQPVVIENIAGGGSMTGTARVAKAAPDGYQFVFASVDSMAIVPTMHKQPAYDSTADFTPVGLVVDQPVVLIVRNDLPVSTMQEFAAYVKANQTKMQFGSSGIGSGSHFSCAWLNAALGVDPTHVPYRSSGQAMQDMIGGRIDYFCALAAAAIGPMESGQAKGIALLTTDRSSLFPGLQTAKEQGIADVDSYFWTAFFLPKGTPPDIVAKLHEATAQTLTTPSTIERLKKTGVTPVAADKRSTDFLGKFVADEVAQWRTAIKASGVTME